MARNVFIIDPSRKATALVDEVTRSLVTLPVAQCQLHLGQLFSTDTFDEAVAADTSIEWLIRVAATNDVYINFGIAAGQDALLEIFETPTTSVDGSALAITNRRRADIKTLEVLAFKGPTSSADGTRIDRLFVPGGSGGNSTGGINMSSIGLILTAGDYLLRGTNKGAAGTNIQMAVSMFEAKPTEES